jgi:hypothetical protein
MKFTLHRSATLVAAGATALAVAIAPPAAAVPSGLICTGTSAGATLCQSNGSAEFSAIPTDGADQQQVPSGLLFHHGATGDEFSAPARNRRDPAGFDNDRSLQITMNVTGIALDCARDTLIYGRHLVG